MKKFIKFLLPILLAIAIILCLCWYLFRYDRAFTRDMLLNCARFSESHGYHSASTWFYNLAYAHAEDRDAVAIELAQQYKKSGNYTKAEFTLSNAIADGGGIDIYIALCKIYVEQDKLLDAVNMLNNITNIQIKEKLDAMRPAAPTCDVEQNKIYTHEISVPIAVDAGTLLVNSQGHYPSTQKDLYSEPIKLGNGVSTIYAVCIADNGLVSPWTKLDFTVEIVKELTFSDTVMEAEIRKLLNIDSDRTLMNSDLWNITEFTVPDGTSDYAVLEHMTHINSLTIHNGVADELHYITKLSTLEELVLTDVVVSKNLLDEIAKLPNLTSLTLQNCGLSGISALTNATKIITLDLSSNAIQDITALNHMKNLQEARLNHNAITTAETLATLPSLKTLDISFNNLTSLSPLSASDSLTWLNASDNVIEETGNLGEIKTLTYLSLENNNLTSVSSIAACTSLSELNIAGNSISNISKLSSLTNLMYFNFAYNAVEELPEFPKDCEMVVITGNNNNISNLKNLSGLKNLNTVNMDYNANISTLKPLESCHNLIEVNVYGTKVRDASALTDASVIVNFTPVG